MKILLIGRNFNIDEVVNFHGICSHFFKKEFEKENEVVTIDFREKNIQGLPQHDVIISLAKLSKLQSFNQKLYRILINKRMYSIANQTTPPARNEIQFSMIKNMNKIWWAAHIDYCYPEKEDGVINILIDHPHYNPRHFHYNKSIDLYKDAIKKLQKDFIIKFKILPINIPWPEVVILYRKANIFCVTHPESCGFSIIESAMSGSHIVIPRGYLVNKDFRKLDHTKFDIKKDKIIDVLKKAIDDMDIQNAINKASEFSWSRSANKVLSYIKNKK